MPIVYGHGSLRGFQPTPREVLERAVVLVAAGMSLKAAGAAVGVSQQTVRRAWRRFGHMELATRHGLRGAAGPIAAAVPGRRALTLDERGAIETGVKIGASMAKIGELIGRDKSVVSREISRNSSPDGCYRAPVAHRVAARRRQRPKPFKLLLEPVLCRRIAAWMDQGWSPKLIALMLRSERATVGDTATVSHETIYQALYVQTRGALRADLARQLSTKRTARVRQGRVRRCPSPFKEAFTISDRPAEVDDRAVPGHWEGDLILGSGNNSAIGTLVERATRFTILLHLPGRHDAASVAEAMIREMRQLPEHLRRSITWDRGTEMAQWADIQLALDTKLFFCDPHSPWQRGTNENTNRLLRFWFEKGSNLSVHTADDLRRIAATLNRRPRPTLDLATPADRLNQLLTAA